MNRYQQNTWRILNGQEPFPTMEEVVEKLKVYVDTYENIPGYKEFTDETLIDDVLYGLGAALSDEYKFANGYEKFKKDLIKYLEGEHEKFNSK